VIIHIFVLANDEPNSLWRTLLDSGFLGGNSLVSALRADPFSAPILNPEHLRYLLDKVRNYFEQNPEEQI
jgi:hypothetical protein